jgi:hypothetical protein
MVAVAGVFLLLVLRQQVQAVETAATEQPRQYLVFP